MVEQEVPGDVRRAGGNAIARLLSEYLAQRPRQAFDWAQNNCSHFAAQWVELATGENPMRALPRTDSALAAARVLHAHGGLAGAWTHALGREPVDAAHAQDGDLLLVDLDGLALDGGLTVAVCSGRHGMAQDAQGAVLLFPRERAFAAWRLQPCPS